MKIIDGKALAKKVREEVKEKLKDDKFKSIPKPHLVVIQVGDDPASEVYIRNKKKACDEVGITFSHYHYKEDTPEYHLVDIVSKLSLSPTVTGILVQLPLPKHINVQNVINAINPEKDADGFTTVQAGMLQLGMKNERRLLPCTAKGIVRLLESVTALEGKKVTVVGRSNIVGKPVAQLLQEKNATVTLCHSKTAVLEEHTGNSDIVVLATGRAEYFNSRYFYGPDNLIIIDAGINRDRNGKLCGDLSKEYIENSSLYTHTSKWLYTPVPGGVGPMTVAELIDNIYIAYKNQFDYLWEYCQNRQISEAELNSFEQV